MIFSLTDVSSRKLGLKQTAQDPDSSFLQPLWHKLSPLYFLHFSPQKSEWIGQSTAGIYWKTSKQENVWDQKDTNTLQNYLRQDLKHYTFFKTLKSLIASNSFNISSLIISNKPIQHIVNSHTIIACAILHMSVIWEESVKKSRISSIWI